MVALKGVRSKASPYVQSLPLQLLFDLSKLLPVAFCMAYKNGNLTHLFSPSVPRLTDKDCRDFIYLKSIFPNSSVARILKKLYSMQTGIS